jgi:hypothetical protein
VITPKDDSMAAVVSDVRPSYTTTVDANLRGPARGQVGLTAPYSGFARISRSTKPVSISGSRAPTPRPVQLTTWQVGNDLRLKYPAGFEPAISASPGARRAH